MDIDFAVDGVAWSLEEKGLDEPSLKVCFMNVKYYKYGIIGIKVDSPRWEIC